MMLRRIVVITGLSVAIGTGWAGGSELQPRQPVPKTPTVMLRVPENATGRLIVKFNDEIKARPLADGSLRSLSMASLEDAEAVFKRFHLVARPAINHPPAKLAALEARAAKFSGRAQPDLAGMMYVDGPRGSLLDAARALNDLEQVEFVELEEVPRLMQEDPDCGTGDWPDTGDCYAPGGNGNAFCNEEACCRLICDNLDPYCCAEDDDNIGVWDFLCAAHANWLCTNGDHCLSPLNGSCFEIHFTAGCNNQECCETVCGLDDRCCVYGWDEVCVELARDNCVNIPDSGPTPDFEILQGYKTFGSWGDTVPEDLQAFVPMVGPVPFAGYGGHGWNMQDPDDEYGGLHGLAQELLEVYGVDGMGLGNLSWGKTVKVAVIEWAYWGPEPYTDSNDNGQHDPGEAYSDLNDNGQWDIGHEDLDVILEPGQTLIQIPELTSPNHGTACLSIIGGVDNGFGVTGIAPDAQTYFFPLTSVEEGPRSLTAWTSAMDMLDYGDVISCSYGPGPPIGNLNNSGSSWTLIRMATDLGITCCIAAGNDCYNLDDAPDLGDSGGLVIGAASPGFPWYRLAFSNFCTEPDNVRSNIVHAKAWGEIVTAAGYGLLFNGDGDPLRSYTPLFNGTSAAAPQVAGLIACLQGLAKQFYGIPLTPGQIRFILGCPGTVPTPLRLFLNGGFGDMDCGLDVDPAEGPNMAGVYPEPVDAAATMLTQDGGGFNDSPLIDSVHILRGNHIFGNGYSVKGTDDWYLIVESKYTERNDGPDGGYSDGSGHSGLISTDPLDPNGPAGQVKYLATGQIVDLMVVGHADIPIVNSLQVTTEIQYPGQTTLLLVELYDWQDMRWQFADVVQLTSDGGGGDILNNHAAYSASRYVRGSDDKIFIRLWTFGLGGWAGGDGTDSYELRVDWVNLEVSELWDAYNDG
ncbi:MAG: S8 family serine peptidase [Phycisphaerales bacterium]|nr:MAG: S8 family serine peptidase [Phycisphaerales bacterium]